MLKRGAWQKHFACHKRTSSKRILKNILKDYSFICVFPVSAFVLAFKYEILFNQSEVYMARKDIHAIDEWPAMARQAAYRAELLAKSLKICPRQLQRYTRELFDSSPQQWLNEQRLADAAVKLRNNHLIKAVALDLGFKRISHFSREFKLRYGVPPSQFQVWSKNQTSQFQTKSAGTQQ